MKRPSTKEEVAAFNDEFARANDIDDYYARSGFLIRHIELRRLAIIKEMMQARAGDQILEVGCGGGHVLQQFGDATLTGVDVSGEMIAKAKKNLAGYDATLLHGDIADQGLEDHGFDGVVCTEVLEHVLEPDAILAEIKRLVKPGGRIVITFPNDKLINGLKGVIRMSGLTRLPPFRRVAWGGDHYHFHVWSIAEMKSLLSNYFTVVRDVYAPNRLMPIRCCFECRG